MAKSNSKKEGDSDLLLGPEQPLNATGNMARETGHTGSEVTLVFGLVVVLIGCQL